MHCDALTLKEPFSGRVNSQELKKSGCVFECLAAFCAGESAEEYVRARDMFYKSARERKFAPARAFSDVVRARERGEPCCALTSENIGFTKGEEGAVRALAADGVVMASLVWNFENSLAYPAVNAKNAGEGSGLKERGRRALEVMIKERIIPDISHLSDVGAREVLSYKIPTVASHSNCRKIFDNARNLPDGLIRAIAQSGGAVGLNFCRKFLGEGDSLELACAHVMHIIKIGGEDTPALGSDWDGVTKADETLLPKDMPALFDRLKKKGLPPRVVQKFACGNFLRVFKEVRG